MTTDTIIAEIVERATPLTRTDIARVLGSVAKPGVKETEKKQAILDLYAKFGTSSTNNQGFDVVHTLETYEEM